MHLDVVVDDLDAAEAAVLDLGATKHEHQPGTSFRVFLDPAGHPFCVSSARASATPSPASDIEERPGSDRIWLPGMTISSRSTKRNYAAHGAIRRRGRRAHRRRPVHRAVEQTLLGKASVDVFHGWRFLPVSIEGVSSPFHCAPREEPRRRRARSRPGLPAHGRIRLSGWVTGHLQVEGPVRPLPAQRGGSGVPVVHIHGFAISAR